jgi:hypothetical protein
LADRRPDAAEAYDTFHLDGGRLVWSTYVFYERLIARLIWPPVSLLHRRLVVRTLARI